MLLGDASQHVVERSINGFLVMNGTLSMDMIHMKVSETGRLHKHTLRTSVEYNILRLRLAW